MKRPPSHPFSLAICVVSLFSCTGSIGSDGNGNSGGVPANQPPGGGSGGGSAGSKATPGTDPGRVTLHRLNRAEYNNTVRDLFGTTSRPADTFPIDDRGSGFDNMADVLTLAPLHLSVFNAAASKLATEALQNATQRAKIVTCDMQSAGDTCVREILKGFTLRAWRRPATDEELTRLMVPVGVARSNGDSYEVGLQLALRAVLLSPHFIFRVELDPDPTSLAPHPLNGYELASRLSYFLWSSMPDDALMQSAASGKLAEPAELASQVGRLLKDAKATALLDNFAGQWLHLRAIDTLVPDADTFPDADAALLSAMKAETSMLFKEIAFAGLPANKLLAADFTFVNDRLAQHYGLPPVGGDELVRVSLAGNTQRKGLLAHGGFLTLTSHPEHTSPVGRGKWVMDELLCAVVPPPPGDVDLSATAMADKQGLTQRQALEVHRADPKCVTCHVLMDPIGLGLENYDAIGRYRTMDVGKPIDSAGQLPSGETFSGATELAEIIAAKPDFARCVAQKLYTYALGRPPSYEDNHMDAWTLENVVATFVANGYQFEHLVSAIATSPTFVQRRGEPGGAP